jgi:hypothetical protein
MGWTSESPARKKWRAKARKAQEERWVAKAGPLKIYYRDPVTGEKRPEEPSEWTANSGPPRQRVGEDRLQGALSWPAVAGL